MECCILYSREYFGHNNVSESQLFNSAGRPATLKPQFNVSDEYDKFMLLMQKGIDKTIPCVSSDTFKPSSRTRGGRYRAKRNLPKWVNASCREAWLSWRRAENNVKSGDLNALPLVYAYKGTLKRLLKLR